MILDQAMADGLIATRKVFIDKKPLTVNRPYNEQKELRSERDPYEVFYLNITQTAIEFGRYFTVTRFFQTPLVRACLDPDAVHPNPDGTKIKGAHIHLYRQGYKDRFAYPLSEKGFTNTEIVPFLKEFLKFCNIEDIGINDQKLLDDSL